MLPYLAILPVLLVSVSLTSQVWFILLSLFLSSSTAGTLTIFVASMRRTHRDEERGDKALDVSVADIFRSDNVALRGEVKELREMVGRQGEKIEGLTRQNSELSAKVMILERDVMRAEILEAEIDRLIDENRRLRGGAAEVKVGDS